MTANDLEELRRRDPVAAGWIDGLLAQLRAAGSEVERLRIELQKAKST